MISAGYKANFETLRMAIKNNNAGLVGCTDVVTGKPVVTVCALNVVDGEYQMVPLAKLFDGNPYEELMPPVPEDDMKYLGKKESADDPH